MFDRIIDTPSPFRKPGKDEEIENQFSSAEFELPDTDLMTEDEALQYLAHILAKWYFIKTYGK